jgi:hypothetical protein
MQTIPSTEQLAISEPSVRNTIEHIQLLCLESWRSDGVSMLRFQIWMEPIEDPLATKLLFDEKATDKSALLTNSGRRTCIGDVDLAVASHMQVVASYELLAIMDPSGEKATAETSEVCCLNSTNVPLL